MKENKFNNITLELSVSFDGEEESNDIILFNMTSIEDIVKALYMNYENYIFDITAISCEQHDEIKEIDNLESLLLNKLREIKSDKDYKNKNKNKDIFHEVIEIEVNESKTMEDMKLEDLEDIILFKIKG